MNHTVAIREIVLAIKEKESLSFVEVANRFGLSKMTVFEWSKRLSSKTIKKNNKNS